FGIQHLKLAGIALAPIGKTIVTKEAAAAARQANAVAAIAAQRNRLVSSQQDPQHALLTGAVLKTGSFKPALLAVGSFVLLAMLFAQFMHRRRRDSDQATGETHRVSHTPAPPATMQPVLPAQAVLARRESNMTPPPTLLAEEIPLIKQGGVYTLPVEINGV